MNFADMKCLWISQFDLAGIYSEGGRQRSKEEFCAYAETVLDRTASCGFNTVFLQMRPNADSMYPSEIYPPSAYVVGRYGNAFSYDPVDILVSMAHARGLSIHAWINPMRGMTEAELLSIRGEYAIRRFYDDEKLRETYLATVDGRIYLNPAYPAVRDLIVAGAAELLSRYPVDGLHMDDYFYPTKEESFDRAAYAEYRKQGGTLSLADFRRDALDRLVAALYRTAKAARTDMYFGISPAGNLHTVYHAQYADVYRWGREDGYVDYLCPQIYFGLEHETFDFIKTADMWHSLIENDRVKLLVGMTLGKAKSRFDPYAGSGKDEWAHRTDILLRCLSYTKTLERAVGVSYFCYQYFYDPLTGLSVKETEAEREKLLPLLKSITWRCEKK